MSPTMTEGNIASWKIHEGMLASRSSRDGAGQSFSSGDILLEIETDKAQMDVEVQDDGVLAKIVVPGGSKNVKVGKTIAILAEHGDDLSAVEVPQEDDIVERPPKQPEIKTKEPQTSSSEGSSSESEGKVHVTGSYSPAVLRLLQDFRIEDPTRINPTGPQGRLLKGDVLAYTGAIAKQVPQTLKEILIKKGQLDLTNIKVRKTETPPPGPPSMSAPLPKPPPEPSSVMRMVRVTELLRMQQKLSGTILGSTATE